MANKITYSDKVGIVPKTIAINQWQDDDANEVKNKHNLNDDRITANEQNIIGLVGGYRGTLSISDTPTLDGYYLAAENGTYVNAGGLVIDLTDGVNYIDVSETQTVFTKVVVPTESDDFKPLNFMDFVTVEADRTKITTNSTNQDDAAMKVYFDNFFNYIKTNNIRVAVVPTGTYRFDKVTVNGLKDLNLMCHGAKFYYNSGDATIEFQACQRVKIYSGEWTSVSPLTNVYADIVFIRITTSSSFVDLIDVLFSEFSRGAILVKSLQGGASSEGVNVLNCKFRNADNYDNVLQSAITFENDGEYCRINGCTFKSVPSAARFVNGANGSFNDNICLGMNGKATDSSYLNAIVYCDNSGTNHGKVDILNSKMNHNVSGIASIVCKGLNNPANAFRIDNIDMLINGNNSTSKSIYIESASGTTISNIKSQGNTLGGAQSNASILINDSPDVLLSNINTVRYLTAVELENNSTNVQLFRSITSDVTNDTVVDGSSSLIIN